MQVMEGSFDTCTEQLFEVTLKLEEEVERSEERLAKAVSELAKQSQRADGAVRKMQSLGSANSSKEEENDKLEVQLKDDKYTLAESERKYEDIARKLATKEDEMARSNERCTGGEKKIIDLEEELKVVGQNLQQLEVSEEKALQREDNYQGQIKDLMDKLKNAENREENATMNIQRSNVRIDQIEEDLLTEKLKIKAVSDELNKTFTDMLNF